MKPVDALAFLEKNVAPVALSDEFCKKYGGYDNSGLIVDCGNDICGALFCLDLTPSALEEAVRQGCNLIITHHPAIFAGVKNISLAAGSATACVAECVRRGISVISMHLNFDAAPQGIDCHLMLGLGGKETLSVMCPLSAGGYGRLFKVLPQSFEEFCRHVQNEFQSPRCRFYAAREHVRVETVVSCCGAGCDEASINFAISGGADTFVSADIKHHHIIALLAAGINVVELTHYSSEIYGLGRIYAAINADMPFPVLFYKQVNLL